MTPVNLSLFDEVPTVPPATAAVLVRSHLRHVKGGKPSVQSVPHNGTATSREAAQATKDSGKAQTQIERVLTVLLDNPKGLTREEIADELTKQGYPICLGSVCGRVADLIRQGHAVETGQTRRQDSGMPQKVVYAGCVSGDGIYQDCQACGGYKTLESRLYRICGQYFLTVRVCSCGRVEVV